MKITAADMEEWATRQRLEYASAPRKVGGRVRIFHYLDSYEKWVVDVSGIPVYKGNSAANAAQIFNAEVKPD